MALAATLGCDGGCGGGGGGGGRKRNRPWSQRSTTTLVAAVWWWVASSAPASAAFAPGFRSAAAAAPATARGRGRRGGGGPLGAASLWDALDPTRSSPAEAFRSPFGRNGERGEYMDGYSPGAMAARCAEDYGWADAGGRDDGRLASERAAMMARLYDEPELWGHVSMVAFAEHYVLTDDGDGGAIARPFETFRRQRSARPPDRPVFAGVVLADWEALGEDGVDEKLLTYERRGIDYVRLECNFGEARDLGGPERLAEDPKIRDRFRRLAKAARACQKREMVPLVLLQVPWRETGGESGRYFEQGIRSFADASRNVGVETTRLLLETRPPVGISAREERDLDGEARISLGLKTGGKMFDVIREAFDGGTVAGFCVAGGSTKGDNPTAMEDDTQNAVRQGMRREAKRQWGYEMCFWEMGAKLMLQPEVGRLWGSGPGGQDSARELFCNNAKALSNEITQEINI